jgi:type I restriction enzyme S subunit
MNGIKYRKPEEMKDSRIDWYEFIPKEWKTIKGKYVFYNKRVINSGKIKEVISLTLNGVIDRDIYSNDGLQPKDFKGYQEFKKDDLVFKLIDLENINTSRVGIVHKDGLMSPAYIRLTTNRRIVNRFYYYLYYSLYIKKIYNNIGNSGVRSSLNAGDLLDIEIFNLDNLEQQKIANFLDIKTAQFDSIISKKELLIQKLEEAKKSLISEVVTGKVKIIDGEMMPRQPEEMKDSGVEWLGMIPKDWEVKKLKMCSVKLIDGDRGSNYPNKDDFFDKGYCLFLNSSNIKNNLINTDEVMFINEKKHRALGNGSIEIKDIVITTRGTVGSLLYFEKFLPHTKVRINSGMLIIRNSEAVLTCSLLFNLLKSEISKRQYKYLMSGSVLSQLPASVLKNINLPIPKPDEQRIISDFVDQMELNFNNTIKKANNQIVQLKQAKQSLISEAVTGKIDLRDWEITEVGEVQ